MLTPGSILVSLLWLVAQIPTPPPPTKRQRGRQETYSDKLFVKALIVMIIRRLYTAYALLSFLDQDDPVAQQIRPLLAEHGRFPTRRTWERRFETLPARLPALIGCLGRHLVTLLQPWAACPHAGDEGTPTAHIGVNDHQRWAHQLQTLLQHKDRLLAGVMFLWEMHIVFLTCSHTATKKADKDFGWKGTRCPNPLAGCKIR